MKLYETLEQQLKKESNFVTDNGELKKWVVLNKAQNFDEELIELLLDNAELKEKFFVSVKGTLVFNLNVLTPNNQAFFLQFYYLFLPTDKRPMVIVIPKVQGA